DLIRRLHEHESEISAPATPASQSPSVSRPSAPAPPSASAASAPPATPEPAFCSSGHPSEASLLGEGGRPETFSAPPSESSPTASTRPPQSCSPGRGRAVCDRDLRQLAAVTSAVPADTPAPSAPTAVTPPS